MLRLRIAASSRVAAITWSEADKQVLVHGNAPVIALYRGRSKEIVAGGYGTCRVVIAEAGQVAI